jgi:hypothetical protein
VYDGDGFRARRATRSSGRSTRSGHRPTRDAHRTTRTISAPRFADSGRNANRRNRNAYVENQCRIRIASGVTAYSIVNSTTRHIEGTADINGQPGTYQTDVTDNGEPRRNDVFALKLSWNSYNAAGNLGRKYPAPLSVSVDAGRERGASQQRRAIEQRAGQLFGPSHSLVADSVSPPAVPHRSATTCSSLSNRRIKLINSVAVRARNPYNYGIVNS